MGRDTHLPPAGPARLATTMSLFESNPEGHTPMADLAIPEHLLRTLQYVQTLNRGGSSPTQFDIDNFATLTPPSDEPSFPWRRLDVMTTLMEREPVAAYMANVGWLSTDGVTYDVSELGAALLKGLSDHSVTLERQVSAVILSPEDPLRYELLTREIGKAGAGLLADPYLKSGHIDWLTTSTMIARVLVGAKRSQERDNALLPFALGRAATAGRTPPEVRITTDPSFHDRIVLGHDGRVSLLGSSLTGISTHVTAIVPLPDEGAMGYRDHVEELWRDATIVEPRDGINTEIA
jgi:hypothetical protein